MEIDLEKQVNWSYLMINCLFDCLQTDLGVTKLSYAQVAQHHREKAEREKHLLQQQQQQQAASQPAGQQQAQAHVINMPQNTNSAAPSDEERKEPSGYYQPKGELAIDLLLIDCIVELPR